MKKHIGLALLLTIISVDCFARGGYTSYSHKPNFLETLLCCIFGIPMLIWFYWQVFVVGTYEVLKDAITKKKNTTTTKTYTQPQQPKTDNLAFDVPESQPYQKPKTMKAIHEIVRPSNYQPKELIGFSPKKP